MGGKGSGMTCAHSIMVDGVVYESIRAASKATGISTSTLMRMYRGERCDNTNCKGHVVLRGDGSKIPDRKAGRRYRRVVWGNEVYQSIKECCDAMGITTGQFKTIKERGKLDGKRVVVVDPPLTQKVERRKGRKVRWGYKHFQSIRDLAEHLGVRRETIWRHIQNGKKLQGKYVDYIGYR